MLPVVNRANVTSMGRRNYSADVWKAYGVGRRGTELAVEIKAGNPSRIDTHLFCNGNSKVSL